MNKVKFKMIMLLLLVMPAINSAFAAPTDTIPMDSVKNCLKKWKDEVSESTSKWIWAKKGSKITIADNVTTDKLLKEQIDSLFNGIKGIFSNATCIIGQSNLNKDDPSRMDLPKNDTALEKAIVTLFKIANGTLEIQETVQQEQTKDGYQINGDQGEDNSPKSKKITEYIPYIIIILLVLILGILYKLFMSKSKNTKPKQRNASLQKKTERPDNNLQEISSLKTRLDQLEAVRQKDYEVISAMNKKLTELEFSIKKIKESMTVVPASKPATSTSTPTPATAPTPNEEPKMQYYFAPPQTDTFAVKVPQTDYIAFWIVEVANENAQTGTYKVNDNKKSQLLEDAELYLKPFMDIQNMNEVSKPTRIEYLSNGEVTRTAEGYWKLTKKAKVNLL